MSVAVVHATNVLTNSAAAAISGRFSAQDNSGRYDSLKRGLHPALSTTAVSPDLGGRGYLTNRRVAQPLAQLREIQTPRRDVPVERFDMAVFFRCVL